MDLFFVYLFLPMFMMLWNLFAVVGIIHTIRYFIARSKKKREGAAISIEKSFPEEKPQTPPELVDTEVESLPTETTVESSTQPAVEQKKVEKPPQDKNLSLLYVGAFLVGFAIFVFIAFNWDSFTAMGRSILILLLILIFYLLTYLFSLKDLFERVSKTFLTLATITIFLAGFGFWNFLIRDSMGFASFEQFWFVYSLLLTLVYFISYYIYRSKAFFILTLLGVYSSLLYSAFVLEIDSKYIPIYILATNVLLLAFMTLSREGRYVFDRFGIPIVRFIAVLLNIINFIYLLTSSFSFMNELDRIVILASIFLPFAVIYLHKPLNQKTSPELLLEGFILPMKVIMLTKSFIIDASSYHFLTVSIVLFLASYIATFSSYFRNREIKQFIYPLLCVSGLMMVAFSFIKPFYIEKWDPLPLAISLMIISVIIQMKSKALSKDWLRYFNIPLDLFCFIAFILAIEQRLNIGLDDPRVIGVLMIIPATVSVGEALLTDRKSLNNPLVVGASIFAITGIILSVPETSFLIVTSLFATMLFKLITVDTGQKYFQILMMASSYLLTITIVEYLVPIHPSTMHISLISLIILSIVYGNLHRLTEYVPYLSKYREILNFTRHISIIGMVGFGFMILIFVFNTKEYIVLASSILISVYLITTWGKQKYLKYFSGIGFVLGFWHIAHDFVTYPTSQCEGCIPYVVTDSSVAPQLYAFPIVIYALVLAYKLDPIKKSLSRVFLAFACILPMGIALIQSTSEPPPSNLYHGLGLILVSAGLILYSTVKKDKLFSSIGTFFIFSELLILLWDVILSIPWWAYIGMIGTGMMGIAIWLIYKMAAKDERG